MRWGAWRRSEPRTGKPLASCEAGSHEEAMRILLPKCSTTDVVIEPMAEPGKSHVGRFFSKSGPVLTEDELRADFG